MTWDWKTSRKWQRYLVAIQLLKFLLLVLLLLSIGSAFQFHLSSNVFAKDKSLVLVEQGAGNGLSSQILLTEKEQAWLDSRHTVRVRVGNVPPYHMSYPEPHGISVDYLRLIGKRFGINFSFVFLPIDWQKALDDLIGEHKWCDLLATITRTPGREREISFTEDYIFSPWVIFNRTDSSFASRMQDLNGKNVAVERGFIILDLVKDKYPQIKIVSFDTSIDALRSVATGKSDAYVGNLTGASYLIRNNGLNNLKVAAPAPFGTHNQAMGVRKDWPELTSIINKALMAMSGAEKSEISNRWLSIRYEYGVNMKRVWSWAAGLTAAFSLIFAVFFIWNRRLKIEIESRKRTEEALRESEEKFRELSIVDGLTGLYNRRGFITLSEQQLKIAERTKKNMLLFFADLDKMKQINDTLGHQEGDKVLIDIATILKEVFRESDIIGRMGGDEFAILAIDTTHETRDVLIKRLNNTLDDYNRPEGRNYQLSLSIGIAHYSPEAPLTLDKFISQADTLMYEEKNNKQH